MPNRAMIEPYNCIQYNRYILSKQKNNEFSACFLNGGMCLPSFI